MNLSVLPKRSYLVHSIDFTGVTKRLCHLHCLEQRIYKKKIIIFTTQAGKKHKFCGTASKRVYMMFGDTSFLL